MQYLMDWHSELFLKKLLAVESPGSFGRDREQGEKKLLIFIIGSNIRSIEVSDTEIITKAMFARR